jgi:hypothetical protein
METFHPSPPWNGRCFKDNRFFVAGGFRVIFEPLPPHHLWYMQNNTTSKLHIRLTSLRLYDMDYVIRNVVKLSSLE